MNPVLIRASAGYLLRHPWQLALALLGIGIGVAVMVSVDLANQSSRKAFIASMDAVNGDATHQILAGPGGIDEAFYVRLRVEEGIHSIAPIVAGNVRVNNRTMQLLGVDVFAERTFRNFSSPANSAPVNDDGSGRGSEDTVRRFLAGDGAVLMSARVATELGIALDEAFDLVANGKSFTARIAGSPGGDQEGQLDSVLVADIAAAQHWLGLAGKLSRIDVKIGEADSELESRLRALLPDGTELLSAAGRTQTTADMSDAFMTNLFAMSLLALLVGIFLIYNSVAFAVLQRRELIGVLRALGVTRRQVFRLILTEAAVIGSLGAALGIFAGIWLGEKLVVLVSRTVSDHYFVVNVTNLSIDSVSVAKGFMAGLLATLVAAAIPAMEASAYQPRLTLSRSTLEARASGMLPKLAGAGIGLMLVAGLILTVSGSHLAPGLVALFMLIFGFALCIPMFVRSLSAAFEPLAGRWGGMTARLAVGSVSKSLSRTGVAVVALSIAVSATIGVSIMVESFRLSVSDWLNTTLQSDVYVGVPRGSLDEQLLADLVVVPGIVEHSTSRRSWLEDRNGRTQIIAIQMASGSYRGTKIRDGNPENVWQLFDQEDGVLVSDAYAYRAQLGRGDSLRLNTANGVVTFTVAAVYQSYDSNNGAVMMSRSTYDRYFDDPAIDSIGLYLRPGTDVDDIMTQLREVASGRQSLIMNSNARIRDFSLQIFDRTFVITNVLYWLAVGVAVIGIFGAMLALQLERAREYGILRAIGMTPGQTGMLVSAQTGCIGILSGVAAIPLGLMMAWVLIEVINRRAFGWEIDFTVPPAVLIWALLLAIGAALLAGIYPAWAAAHTRPALAMRDE
ncbi:MAG: FtsX-like permease family protein [Woeseiaceae bacterium]